LMAPSTYNITHKGSSDFGIPGLIGALTYTHQNVQKVISTTLESE